MGRKGGGGWEVRGGRGGEGGGGGEVGVGERGLVLGVLDAIG